MAGELRYDPTTGQLIYDHHTGDLVYELIDDCGGTACSNCDTGTVHANIQVTLPGDMTDGSLGGTCTNCPGISGATFTLPQVHLAMTCDWRLQFTPGGGPCQYTLHVVYDGTNLTVALWTTDETSTVVTEWNLVTGTTDCAWSALSIPFSSTTGTACYTAGANPCTVTVV